MHKNYITAAFRNLLKYRLFSAINIIGLALGLAVCLLISLYVQHENSFDRHWQDADRIYRVNFAADMPGRGITQFTEIPILAMPALAAYFQQEIESSTRIVWQSGIIHKDEAAFNEVLYKVDPQFPELFGYEIVDGSLATTLSGPANMALSTERASRYFGTENPLGQTLTLETSSATKEYRITAIYDVPDNTILDMPMLALLDESSLAAEFFSWVSLTSDSYFKLKPGVDIAQLNARIKEFTDQNVDVSSFFPGPNLITSEVALYSFQPMTEIYLNSPWDLRRNLGNKTQVLAFSAIAMLVLALACINYTILAVARSSQRSPEVAVRKVMGARKGQLIVQFLGESYAVVLLALLCALGLVEFLLPVFAELVGRNLAVPYASSFFLLSLLGLFLLVGLLGGLYPAFVLAGFHPVQVLKGNRITDKSGARHLRNALVVFQFGVSISLIVATAVIYLQVEHASRRDPGFNKDNLLVINGIDSRRELYPLVDTLKREILKLPDVSAAGLSTWRPSQKNQGVGSYDLKGEDGGNFIIARTGVGFDFFSTYQIPLLAGRGFSESLDLQDPIYTLDPDITEAEFTAPRNVLINQSAVRQFGFSNTEQAIGRVFRSVNPEDGHRDYTIVGVVADTHFYSINEPPRAEVFHLTSYRPNIVTVRFTGSPQAMVEQLAVVWRSVMGDREFYHAFVEQLLADEFRQQKTEARILLGFSLLAICIACLGLFGSTIFTIARRTKEIGIRKVMGAEAREIVALLLWQFSRPVLLANLIAWPVIMWVMLRWLQQFPYQINALLLIPLCVLAGTIVLSIAWLTVVSNTVRVASAKPVLALRYE